jgi:hypothetical protein
MLRKEHNGISWLEFELFAEESKLRHRLFLRQGGHSQGAFSSLNMGTRMGDDLQSVQLNRIKAHQHIPHEQMIYANQCHGKDVVEVTSEMASTPPIADGLSTQQPHMALAICHADCQAAIFYDPIQQALADVHSGWRGNVLNIYKESIRFMGQRFGCHPSNLLVGISPSLGPERAEFINYHTEFPREFWQFQVSPNYFDLWNLAEWQLTEAGIFPHHIQIARLSTWAHPMDFFSYRRSKTTGCHATIAVLC